MILQFLRVHNRESGLTKLFISHTRRRNINKNNNAIFSTKLIQLMVEAARKREASSSSLTFNFCNFVQIKDSKTLIKQKIETLLNKVYIEIGGNVKLKLVHGFHKN